MTDFEYEIYYNDMLEKYLSEYHCDTEDYKEQQEYLNKQDIKEEKCAH